MLNREPVEIKLDDIKLKILNNLYNSPLKQKAVIPGMKKTDLVFELSQLRKASLIKRKNNKWEITNRGRKVINGTMPEEGTHACKII